MFDWYTQGSPTECRPKRQGAQELTYTVIYERGPESWGAYVPDLPGVIAAAETRDEVEALIREAVEFHIDGLQAERLPIPVPASEAGVLEVEPAA